MPRRAAAKATGVWEKVQGPESGGFVIAKMAFSITRKLAENRMPSQLYQQRKSSIRAGAKLPLNMRLASVRFQSLADEILLFSQNHHRDKRNIASRLKCILPDFGNRLADQIKPADIDGWIESLSCPFLADLSGSAA